MALSHSELETAPSGQDRREHASRIVWALAWPAVALNSLQVVNSMLDSFFMGRLPQAASTAVGASTSVVFLLFSMAAALGVASTAIVSRAYGAGKVEEFKAASRQCLSLSILAGILFAIFGWAVAPHASEFFNQASDRSAVQQMTMYIGVYVVGLPAMFIIQTLAGALRGIGDTKSPMIISGIQILMHITLNFLLIFPARNLDFAMPVTGAAVHMVIPGANMGLAGAVTAMVTSAWVSAIGYFIWSARTPLGKSHFFALPSPEWIWRILRIAYPASLMSIVRVGSLMAFNKILVSVPHGSEAIGSIRYGFAVESVAFMPAFGLSIAAATLVGQSLGMKKPERAERLAWLAAHHAAIVSLVAAGIMFFLADHMAGLLIQDKPIMARIVADYIRFICATELFFGYGTVLTGAMQGAGDTVSPFWLVVVSMWGLRVPLAFLFALSISVPWLPFNLGIGMGYQGCWLSMSATQVVAGILAIWLFKKGRWKLKKV